MSEVLTELVDPRDLETKGLIDSLISRAERILARDLTAPVVQRALVALAQDKTIELLLDKAGTAATVAEFDIDIKEAPADVKITSTLAERQQWQL